MAVPEAARALFGDAVGLAERYADTLATTGVEWGLIGPREVDRIWERHVLNSLAVSGQVAAGARVADVGSGAGLPGVALAIARDDIHVVLVEPLLRRATFLERVVEELKLGDRVSVSRGRAEDHRATYDVVTARALAPLPRLLRWCWPLVAGGGRLVAMKGESAQREVADAAGDLARLRASARVETVSLHPDLEPTRLVVVERR